MTVMSVPAVTAEWNCTRCGSTNRKLVPAQTLRSSDRCNHCRARHVIEPDDRPVRWKARLDD
jgi:DNA-directed RNA polymerase subunit RPC12/RpoP